MHYFWPEREHIRSSKVPGYRSFWSNRGGNAFPCPWEQFLIPSGSVQNSVQRAKDVGINDKIQNSPAVYEFAIVHPDRPNKRVKVYLGKTTDLKRRHNDYLGSSKEMVRMWPFFEYALQNGCQVWRRYCYLKTPKGYKVKSETEGDRAVTMMETRWLSYFDYAWNKEANPPKRMVYLEPRRVFCFIPSGVNIRAQPVAKGSKDSNYFDEFEGEV